MGVKWWLGIDPGKSTGMVLCNERDEVEWVWTAKDHEEIASCIDTCIEESVMYDLVVVIESFSGAGHLNNDSIVTLTRLGFVHGYAEAKGLEVLFQAPQKRLAYEERARQVFSEHIQRHQRSAFAHALCAHENYKGENG